MEIKKAIVLSPHLFENPVGEVVSGGGPMPPLVLWDLEMGTGDSPANRWGDNTYAENNDGTAAHGWGELAAMANPNFEGGSGEGAGLGGPPGKQGYCYDGQLSEAVGGYAGVLGHSQGSVVAGGV